MEEQQKKSGSFIAIATMFALYAMCGFMTYLAAPAGKIWGGSPGIAGSTTLGMMGNMMNFLAYLVMGYPMGMVLQKFGYKVTALLACGSGAAGILVQLASGHVDLGVAGGVPAAWYVYLFGAFISGASNCLLNTVINPMLNQIVGGGKKGNQLNLAGGAIGTSLLEADKQDYALEMIEKAKKNGVKLLLPVDTVCAKEFKADAEPVTVDAGKIPADMMGLDIGPKTIELFCGAVKGAGTIVWNGPMGVFEFPAFAVGTEAMAKALAESGAVTIIGGGDSAAAAEQLGFADKITHISTGGGASLEFLEGKELPGVACLLDK